MAPGPDGLGPTGNTAGYGEAGYARGTHRRLGRLGLGQPKIEARGRGSGFCHGQGQIEYRRRPIRVDDRPRRVGQVEKHWRPRVGGITGGGEIDDDRGDVRTCVVAADGKIEGHRDTEVCDGIRARHGQVEARPRWVDARVRHIDDGLRQAQAGRSRSLGKVGRRISAFVLGTPE